MGGTASCNWNACTAKSHRLSLQQTDDAVSPYELTEILNTNSIRYVLIGGHVLGMSHRLAQSNHRCGRVDTPALTQLGDLVYPGGGRELCDLVTAVRQGKKATL